MPELLRECVVCYESIVSRATRCPICGAQLAGRDVGDPRLAREGRDPVGKAELSEFQIQFRRQFEERGIYVSVPELRRAEQVLSNARAELRKANVLFVDLCGFTRLGRALAPEQIGQILKAYYDLCTLAVLRHRGFVVKLLGDGILAVFGAPVAYDRDAESCVRAALEIRDAAGRLPTSGKRPIEVSVGIATGEVLSTHVETGSRGAYDILGAAVNLAQRLQSAAGPNEILICQDTFEQAGPFFECRRSRPLRLKNLARAYVAWRVLDEKDPQAFRRVFNAPFSGRRQEMERLRRALEESSRGELRVVHVVGEPGIGKTRFVHEALRDRSESATVLFGECAPHGQSVLLYPVMDWVRSLLGLAPGDSANRVARCIEEYFGERPGFAETDAILLGYLFSLPSSIEALTGLPVERLQKNLFALLRGILDDLARRRPVVLVLDDLQWIDPLSRQWIDSLVEHWKEGPLLLVLIYRANGGTRLGPHPGAVRIPLRPLPQRDRMQILQALLPLREFLPEIREAVLSRSSGNPLFIEEMSKLILRHIEENGINSLAQIRNHVVDVVPVSLQSLLQSRIDQLSERTKAVLQCGAVLGVRFALGLIELFDLIRDGLLEHLYTLKSMRYLEETRTSCEVEYLFVHSLMQEVAYGTLLHDQRERLHEYVAQQIEQRFADRLPEFLDALVYHYGHTGRREKTLYYLIKSGDHAMAMNAAADAVERYHQAAALLDATAPTEAHQLQLGRLLVRLGRLHRTLGQNEQAFETLAAGLRLAERLGNDHLAADGHIELGVTHLVAGHRTEAFESFTQALALSRQIANAHAEAVSLNSLGVLRYHEGEFEDALSYFHSVLALLKIHSFAAIEADVYNNVGMILWRWGQYGEALKNLRQAIPLRHQAHDRFGLAATLLNIGLMEEQFGRMTAARKAYTTALGLAEQLGFVQAQGVLETNLSNLHRRWGDPAAALDHAARAVELTRKAGDRHTEVYAIENLGLAYRASNNPDEARRHLESALKLAKRLGDREPAATVELDLLDLELDQFTSGSPTSDPCSSPTGREGQESGERQEARGETEERRGPTVREGKERSERQEARGESDQCSSPTGREGSGQSDERSSPTVKEGTKSADAPEHLLPVINRLFRRIEKANWRDLLPRISRIKGRCLAAAKTANGAPALEYFQMSLEYAKSLQNIHEELETLEALSAWRRQQGQTREAEDHSRRIEKIRATLKR